MTGPEPRLRAGVWVAAYLARLSGLAIPAFVVRRGDETAGAVLVKASRSWRAACPTALMVSPPLPSTMPRCPSRAT